MTIEIKKCRTSTDFPIEHELNTKLPNYQIAIWQIVNHKFGFIKVYNVHKR